LENPSEYFDRLSMNGKISTIPNFSPFALRLSKGGRRFFNSLLKAEHAR